MPSIIDQVVPTPKSQLSQNAKQNLVDFATKIDSYLKQYFQQQIQNPFGVSQKQKDLSRLLWQHIAEHCLRPAKRLRASFIYYGYRLLGGTDLENILQAAISIELIHTALLMHDDFMDQDDLRRGLPTSHKYFEALHRQKKYQGDPTHHGASLAITAGDIALCAGFEILGTTSFDPVLKNKALTQVFQGITQTALGQAYDLTLQAQGNATESDILDLHTAKTAIYTYENPLHIGALLAGANDHDLQVISDYALPAGIAFQLQDDILGLFGDPQKTGKSAHSDIKQGKMTLLIIHALKHASTTQKRQLLKHWGNPKLTEAQAQTVRQIIKDTASLQYSQKISIKHAKRAQRAVSQIQALDWNQESLDYLNGIAQYMIERDI